MSKTKTDFLSKGNTLYRSGNYSEAIKAYDKVIKHDANNTDAYYNKGISMSSLQLYKEAIKAYDQAIKINPILLKAHLNKAIALDKLPQFGISV